MIQGKLPILIAPLLLLVVGMTVSWATPLPTSTVSGRLENGYRVLELPVDETELDYTVYRGDYIKFDRGEVTDLALLEIPSLSIRKEVNGTVTESPYFKMKRVGSYPFVLGSSRGVIRVVEYDRPQYAVLKADEAAALIRNISPFILDVRTGQEYSSGHLENSVLIPVQELQRRYTELMEYKDEDIFIYCATGNRSTVAAKILIDNGFTRIHNLRYGIFDWVRNGYPVKK